ncbi:integral membrane protein GPR180-like [Oncorhynchus keta]|uniref:integral membrane protein GPR180-like n=1 Tax=Oncorhynchus gorbuscha TaxID=8017 RepID=UPI001EAEE1E2|nr:integral membrane protein GPR180-like [Oncorhynchus gorbuscha]XP_052355514.1 integral membrane protein GPR180-like [Oncorhynchus keta]
MYPLMFTFTAFLLCIPATFGKTVSGVFKSDAAREQNGQYITKFMYNVGRGLVVCRLENATLAMEKESRLLLFPETEDGFDIDNLSCHDRLSKAQLSIRLSEEEHNQSIPHLHSPTAWMALYADRYTCGEGGIIPAHGDLTFTILLFNPDSAGNPLEHFSAEEAGLYSFYCLLILAYFVASCIYIQPLWMALRKGGPMQTVLKVLSTALALQGISALFNYIHLARYARDGVGIPIMGSLAEFCDMVSQVSMLYMLLSLCVGWTLSKNRKPQSRPLQWDSSPASKALAMGGVVTQGVLLLWEQYEETEHHSYHAQRSIAGLLLISLRIILALLLASVLYTIISTERSALKRDFYLSFAKGCFIWFLCHPVLVLLSVVFNEHQREKVVTIGVILCQAISVVILYQLFLSRSLYWEVSSLSSVSLPLTMSRGGRGRY